MGLIVHLSVSYMIQPQRYARYCHLKQTSKPDRIVIRNRNCNCPFAPKVSPSVIKAPGELPLCQIARSAVSLGRLSDNTIKISCNDIVIKQTSKRMLSFEADRFVFQQRVDYDYRKGPSTSGYFGQIRGTTSECITSVSDDNATHPITDRRLSQITIYAREIPVLPAPDHMIFSLNREDPCIPVKSKASHFRALGKPHPHAPYELLGAMRSSERERSPATGLGGKTGRKGYCLLKQTIVSVDTDSVYPYNRTK